MSLWDRSRRDSSLFQFTTKQLGDFIDPNHLLIRIDEQLDFAKLVAPLEDWVLSRLRQTGDPPRERVPETGLGHARTNEASKGLVD